MIFKSTRKFIAMGLAVLSASAILGSIATAGEVLRLKAGPVDATEFESRLESRPLAPNANGYFIVQFNSVIRGEDRQGIETLGAKIIRYLPDDAYIVRAKASAIANIRKSMPAIRAVTRFEPAWKQSPDFAPASVFNARSSQELVVRLYPGEDSRTLAAQLGALSGVESVSTSGRTLVVKAARSQVDVLASIEEVEWIEPNPKFEFMQMRGLADAVQPAHVRGYEDLTGYESGSALMGFATTWSRGFTGRGQIASMADTGLDRGDLSQMHADFGTRVLAGYPFGMFSKTWEDPMGHGTHVAGSVTGNGQISGGRVRGGAYEASFIAESLWSPMLDNLSLPSRLGDLFSKAYAGGARIHTNSWGSAAANGAYDSFAQQVDEFVAANPEMLILFAAGNSGVDHDRDGRVDPNSIGSPGTAKNILTVGASKNYVLKGGLQIKLSETRLKDSWPTEPLASSRFSENPQGLAAFSSRGPTQDGRLKPEIVAPGTNILSTRSQHPKAEALWGFYDQNYVWSGGTSMATPLAAGAATVVRQYLVDGRGIANPSAALIKAAMMHTAVDLYPGQFGEVGRASGQEILTRRPNSDEGYGRVDVGRATDLGRAVLVDERGGVGQGQAQTYPVQVSGRGHLVATLVYTDAAGAASAAKALVNDLDLVVVDPSGRQTSLGDRLNNAEMVEMDVVPGQYQIRVQGTNVPQGPASGRQPYALIISLN